MDSKTLRFLLAVCIMVQCCVCQHTEAYSTKTRRVATDMCPTPPAPQNGDVSCDYSDALQLEIFCTITCNTGYKFDMTDTTDFEFPCDVATGFYDQVTTPPCVPNCDPPCLNGGQCVDPNKCLCPPPYYGEQCLHGGAPCNNYVPPRFGSLDCKSDIDGGKVCIPQCLPTFVFESSPPEKYVCTKDGVWTPDINKVPDCIQEIISVHPCNMTCLNGGRCTRTNTCNCTAPYSGDHCQTFAIVSGVTSTRCPLPAPLTNGVIDCHYSNTSNNQIICQYNCTSGYMFEGTRSHTFDFTCDVSLGYYDPPLTPGCVPSCHPPCSNGGLCMKNNTCSCVPPYTGDRCLTQLSVVG